VSKTVAFVLAATGFAASAHAADLSVDSLKDPLPDKISFAGVTLYGTVDVGYAYQQHGYDYSGAWGNALNYQPKPSVLSTLPSRSVLTNNALSQSTVGIKIEESIGYGFAAIGKLETGFNPLSGELADGPKSLEQNVAKNPQLAAYSDSARAGQLLNGEAYAGLSNASYGTLTIGRQNSLLRDAVGAYDPNKGSVAFSLIGNTGTIVQGAGNTEASIWDNSIRYVYQYGPAHATVIYSDGGNNTSLLGYGVGANVGVTYKGFSIDGYYTKENAAVGLDSATAAFTNSFNYTVSNNEAWGVAAKYALELGGGFKDESASKLTFFGGYVSVDSTNPDHAQSYYAGQATLGGYQLNTASYTTAYVTDRTIQTGWLGASYETGPWTFTGTWYRENQNTFKTSNADPSKGYGGDIDWVSGVVDYKFNKHFDIYGGVSWVDFSGDWTHDKNGVKYSATQEVNVATGVRLKF
jgi:predicted porin